MSDSDPKPTSAALVEELERLQQAGDEIRARIKITMEELEANAIEVQAIMEQQAANRKADNGGAG